MALSDDDRARVALGHAMERLVASAEWETFVEWVQANPAQSEYRRALAPAKSMDEALQGEYAKGTLKGIELTLVAPSNIIREMQKILAEEALTHEDDDEYPRRNVNYERDDLDGSIGGTSP